MNHRAGDDQPGLFGDRHIHIREMAVSAQVTCDMHATRLLKKVVPVGARWFKPNPPRWIIGLSHLDRLVDEFTAAGHTVTHERPAR